MNSTSASLPSSRPQVERDAPSIPPVLLWFAVAGGSAAWAVHELLAWSAMEIACLGSRPGPGLYIFMGLVTGIPFAIALLAFGVGMMLRARLSRVPSDQLARGRTHLLLTIGPVLDGLAMAAILGDGIAILVLKPC